MKPSLAPGLNTYPAANFAGWRYMPVLVNTPGGSMGKLDELIHKVNTIYNDECWRWPGTGRYNFVWVPRTNTTPSRNLTAHSVAYKLRYGEVPTGLELVHTCMNRCWNPDHVRPLTHAENLLENRNQPAKTNCPHGHPYVDGNIIWSTKLCKLGYARYYKTCRTCSNTKQRAANKIRYAAFKSEMADVERTLAIAFSG